MKEQNDIQQDSLFSIVPGGGHEASDIVAYKIQMMEEVQTTWQELFHGFDELHAITYSLGIKQVESVMGLFQRGDVVIGSPSQVRQAVQELLAEQEFDLKTICQNAYLQQRIKDGSFQFYLEDGGVHAKIYLLRADDGRNRIILGSANFSRQAWNGTQLETYLFEDDSQFFEHYMQLYEALRDESSSKVSIKAKPLRADGSNLQDLPIIQKVVQARKPVIIEKVPSREEVEYTFSVTQEGKEWAERVNHAYVKPDNHGVVHFTSKTVDRMQAYMKRSEHEKKLRVVENPEFLLDYKEHSASFSGKAWDLNPSKEDVQRDIHCLYQYLDGTEGFTGDIKKLQETYTKILLYMFLSPFMAKLRYDYSPYAPENSVGKYFPMYMIIRGPKSGGKSSIIRTGQHLMFGKSLHTLPTSVISPIKLDAYKVGIKGCPVLIDDVTNSRFRYLKDIVKSDDALIRGHNINHGTFLITTNDGQVLDPSVIKRTLVFTIPNQLAEDESVKRDSSFAQLQKKMGNALYRAFLHRMFDEIDAFSDYMVSDTKKMDGWFPDIFKVGAKILQKVIADVDMELYPSIKLFTWQDFMGEMTKSQKAIYILSALFDDYSDCFHVKKETDSLRVDFSTAESKQVNKFLDMLQNELPVSLEPHMIGNVLQLRYSKTKEVTGIDFQKQKDFFSRISSIFRGD